MRAVKQASLEARHGARASNGHIIGGMWLFRRLVGALFILDIIVEKCVIFLLCLTGCAFAVMSSL